MRKKLDGSEEFQPRYRLSQGVRSTVNFKITFVTSPTLIATLFIKVSQTQQSIE